MIFSITEPDKNILEIAAEGKTNTRRIMSTIKECA
jgi:hypothetical protein